MYKRVLWVMGVLGLLGVVFVMTTSGQGDPLAPVPREVEQGTDLHHRCRHPRGGDLVGECAEFCPDYQNCKDCCNRAYPRYSERDHYRECKLRCLDVHLFFSQACQGM